MKIASLIVPVIVMVALVVPFTSVVSEAVEDNDLNVVIIAGQSNAMPMAGTPDIEAPSQSVYYYGTDTAEASFGIRWDIPSYDTTFASYSMQSAYDSGWKVGGYVPELGRLLTEKAGGDVYIISVGISGAPVYQLGTQNPDGQYVEQAISHALAGITGYSGINKVGVVWAQGESDKNDTIEYYTAGFNAVYDWYCSIGFEDFYVIKTRDATGGNTIEAMNQIAAANSKIMIATDITDTFTADNGLLNSDGMHYTQAGRTLIAQKIAPHISIDVGKSSPWGSVYTIAMLVPLIIVAGIVILVVKHILISRD